MVASLIGLPLSSDSLRKMMSLGYQFDALIRWQGYYGLKKFFVSEV